MTSSGKEHRGHADRCGILAAMRRDEAEHTAWGFFMWDE
jgi:hypothetical protein